MTELGQGTKSLLGFTLATSALPPIASQAWDAEGTWGGIWRYNSYVGILLALGILSAVKTEVKLSLISLGTFILVQMVSCSHALYPLALFL